MFWGGAEAIAKQAQQGVGQAVKWAIKSAEGYRQYAERLEYTGFRGREPHRAERVEQLVGLVVATKAAAEANSDKNAEEQASGTGVGAVFKQEYRLQRMLEELEELNTLLGGTLPSPDQQYSSSSRVMTPEYHRELVVLLGQAEDYLRQYRAALGEMHLEEEILARVAESDDSGDARHLRLLERLQVRYEEYLQKEKGRYVVALYARSLQKLLETAPKPVGQAILRQLEQVKTAVLAPASKEVPAAHNRTNGIQLMVNTYNLLPGEGKPLEDLLQGILRPEKAPRSEAAPSARKGGGAGDREDPDEDGETGEGVNGAMDGTGLDSRVDGGGMDCTGMVGRVDGRVEGGGENRADGRVDGGAPRARASPDDVILAKLRTAARLLSTDRKIGFVLIDRRTPAPAEYRFPFSQRAGAAGIDAALREERTTLLVHPPERLASGVQKPGAAVERVSGTDKIEDGTEFYVLDRIGHDRFRCLSWRPLPAAWLENLGRVDRWPSTRVTGYNQRLEEALLGHLTSPIAKFPRLSRAEVRRDEAFWRNTHARILERIQAEPAFRSGRLSAKDAMRVITEVLLATMPSISAGAGAVERWTPAERRLYDREMRTTYWAEAETLQGRVETALKSGNALEGLGALLPQVFNAKSNLYRELDHKHTILSAALRRETRIQE